MGSRREETSSLVGTEAEVKEGGARSKLKGFGSPSSKDVFFRADKIDLKSLDIQMEKKLNKAWGKDKAERPREKWEIDLSKLVIRYEVARGTYGTVYRGTYDGQDVAVKLLDWGEDGYATEAETVAVRASFQKEVAVWYKLDHPNVTKFVGASMGTSELKIPQKNSTSNGNKCVPARACCVIVEYLPGGTLKQFLIRNSRKKLPYKIVIQLALDLSRGLSYLHSQKIVHRDVKTENMLLDGQRNLKIADFGVARVEAQNPKDMTGETGTLGYMAPEVLDGKPYNRKCDVYSFGICLWEIYCCDMPYPNLSFVDVSSAVVRQVHLDYLEAGANIIISASYQATIQGFEDRGFSKEESETLLRKSVKIACEARDIFQKTCPNAPCTDNADEINSRKHPILVAASIGSYGAYLADGSEYSGDYGEEVTLETLKDFHRRRLQVLAESGADLVAFETIPNKVEAQAYAELLNENNIVIPAWFSFSSMDGYNVVSGDSIVECTLIADTCKNVAAVGINCTSPRCILGLILSIRKATSKPIIIYPNSGEHYDAEKKEWVVSTRVSDDDFVSYVNKWIEAGASLIGGCCRTTPKTIRAIAMALSKGHQLPLPASS